MKKKVKKWQKVIAAIVLAAFLFQCGPVYALDQLPIDTSNLPAATETKEATENSTSAIAEEETEDASAGEETETSLGVEKKAENVSSIFDSASEYDSPEVLTDVLSGVETERENDKVLSSSTKHEIDGELEELREANVQYFLNTDKSITAATYPYDIHYLNDEGVYEEIDNSFVDGTDSDTGDALENTANNMGVKFAKKAKESNMVKMQFDGHKISWGLENANKKKSVRDNTLAQFNFSHDPLLLQDKMYPIPLFARISICIMMLSAQR